MQENWKRRFRRFARRLWHLRADVWRQNKLHKYEIINALARKHEYKSYLEICTPTTGGTFCRVHPARLDVCHRLMYRCPQDYDSGDAIHFRSADESVEHLLVVEPRYDLVFVDAWHTYDCAERDLRLAFSLVKPGGALVAHDCSPALRREACPEFIPGPWSGVSYCAYVDFLLAHPELEHYTVDTDCGCGVVYKRLRTSQIPKSLPNPDVVALWRWLRNSGADMFDFFAENKEDLLNLVSVEQFLAIKQVAVPWRLRFAQAFPGAPLWHARRKECGIDCQQATIRRARA